MGIREDVLALADDVESTIGGCYGCLLDKRGLCKAESDFDCNDEVCKFVAHRLRAIAEKDAENVTTVSAYDLLPDEDRKAIAWVREHGGLEAVKAYIHQGTREHGCLLKIAEMLGTSIYDGTDNADALLDKLRKRLMPDGMEWPKVDGKPVDFVTGYEPSLGVLEAVSIYSNGACEVMSHDGIVKNATEIHVFKPKVLDADGVEIREGDTVWTDYGDGPWTVTRITTAHAWHVYGHSDELGSLDMQPNLLTHRAPVLAADGRPLKKGETVWDTKGNGPYTITEIDGDSNVYIEGGSIPYCGADFIRKNPDTWERINDDATLAPGVYCDRYSLFYEDDYATAMAQDLVRRAKKLAERGA